MADPAVSPARRAAHAALLRAAASHSHLDLNPAAVPELRELDSRDAALAMELAAGTLKRRGTLDAVLERCSAHPLKKVSTAAVAALRMGAYQLLYLDRVPAHAAVGESVALVDREGAGTRGFVNAVLRRVSADGRDILTELTSSVDLKSVALRHSYPLWLARLWTDEFGAQAAAELMEAGNCAPERCLRANLLAGTRDSAVERLAGDGVAATPVDGFSEALVITGPPMERTAAFREGLVTPQSRGSQLAGRVAAEAVRPGAAVADLCAAPGLKTAQLAAASPARLLAVEKDERRATEMRLTLTRLRVSGAETIAGDALDLSATEDGAFDAVLLDAPCTGLGTLSSRADLRWRRYRADVDRLADLQRRLLRRAAALLRPGGALTYSVCTLTRAETLAVIDDLLSSGGWTLDDLGAQFPKFVHPERGGTLLTWPPRDHTTGFFIARLRRDA
jgi:16S rRNA (cytosine967-C5)-methyltransferase